jgi:hypothetical protein
MSFKLAQGRNMGKTTQNMHGTNFLIMRRNVLIARHPKWAARQSGCGIARVLHK